MRKIHRPMIFAAAAVLWLAGLVSGCGGSAGMPAAGGEISQSGSEMTGEEQGEELLPAGPCELPYHLEPDHIEAEDGGSKNGKDAAY